MTFKYFDNPEVFIGFLEDETTCDICGEIKLCFDAQSFIGEDAISSICSECLATGKLLEKELFTCEGDISELKRQIREINPAMGDDEIDVLAENKTLELEKTTPHLVTWQDWNWPCADGDYCKFIGYGSKPFYDVLALDGNGRKLFENSIYYELRDDSDIEQLWNEELPEKSINNYAESNNFSTVFYVFKSLISEKIITIWDCN